MTASAGPAALPPAELLVQLAPDVLRRDGGRLLVGGSPGRLMRLTAAGTETVTRWCAAPAPVGTSEADRGLARRLLDAAMLEPVPEPSPSVAGVDIVVPVHDRPERLARCLAALTATAPGLPVTVVDDASADPEGIAAVARREGARLIRHDRNQGPASARNKGAAATQSALLLFVDSDVVVGPDRAWLRTLAAHFADPEVGAVGPRVLAARNTGGLLAGWEARHSSLDMGERGGAVAPARWTSYVPSTVLMVRRCAMPDGGFDESMRVGEDVDFIWRLVADGWRAIYDPRVGVRHDHRLSPVAFFARRREYAMSIAPLARRHPDAVPALRAAPATFALLALLAIGRVRPALAVVLVRALRLRRQLEGRSDDPTRLTLELTGRTAFGMARGASHAVRRAWSPLILVLGRRWPRAVAVFAVAELARLVTERLAEHPVDLLVGVADDLIAAAGTWEGCLRHRTLRPLLPSLARRAGDGRLLSER